MSSELQIVCIYGVRKLHTLNPEQINNELFVNVNEHLPLSEKFPTRKIELDALN